MIPKYEGTPFKTLNDSLGIDTYPIDAQSSTDTNQSHAGISSTEQIAPHPY